MSGSELIKKADLQRIAKKGQDIYSRIRKEYEPEKNGNFLAIEIDSGEVFLSKDGANAVAKAKKKHPDKVFYLVKIGHESAETIAQSLLARS